MLAENLTIEGNFIDSAATGAPVTVGIVFQR